MSGEDLDKNLGADGVECISSGAEVPVPGSVSVSVPAPAENEDSAANAASKRLTQSLLSQNLRQRIRKRDVDVEKRTRDKGIVEKDIGWLVSPDELLNFRKTAWIPRGENIPPVHTLDMSFWEACNKGMKGWMGPKLCGEWDVMWGPNKLRFFVMDGTNEDSFLTYYTCSDTKVSWGSVSEKKGVICAADLRDAYWIYNKKKVKLNRSDKGGKLEILRDIPESYYDAIMVCIRELEVSKMSTRLRDKRLLAALEPFRKQQAADKELRHRQKTINQGSSFQQQSVPQSSAPAQTSQPASSSSPKAAAAEIGPKQSFRWQGSVADGSRSIGEKVDTPGSMVSRSSSRGLVTRTMQRQSSLPARKQREAELALIDGGPLSPDIFCPM